MTRLRDAACVGVLAVTAERDAARADAAALAGALDVFVRRCARVSASSDPLYCIHEADVTDAEKQDATAALSAHRARVAQEVKP
jgi:hypothetical protein